MARALVEHPLVERWRLASQLQSAPQYARLVQRCLRQTGCESPADATPALLLEHVVGLNSKSVRRKTISALEAFFGDLAGELGADPAAGLPRKARDRLRNRGLRAAVGASGIVLDGIVWRDIARVTFGPDRARRVVAEGADVPAVLRDLSVRLLDRLRAIKIDELDRFLDSPVFFGEAGTEG